MSFDKSSPLLDMEGWKALAFLSLILSINAALGEVDRSYNIPLTGLAGVGGWVGVYVCARVRACVCVRAGALCLLDIVCARHPRAVVMLSFSVSQS